MANDNPFAAMEEAERAQREQSPLLTPGQTPQVPISAPNPFDEGAPPVSYPHPPTLMGNVTDVIKPAADTFSMGINNRLIGLQQYLLGNAPSYSAGVDQAVADSAMRAERSPYLNLAGQTAGGVAQAFVPGVGTIGRTVSPMLGGTAAGVKGTLGRMAGYGIEGGVLGAGQAAGHTYTGNPSDYAANALVGGALGSALGAPFGKFADVRPQSAAAVPNSGDLFGSSRGHYQMTHSSPLRYDTTTVRNDLNALETDLQSPAYGVVKVPDNKTFAVIDYLRKLKPSDPAGYSPYEFDAARKQLTGVTDPGASAVRKWIDDFMVSPGGVNVGTPTDQGLVAHWLDLARGDYRAGKRTQAVEQANQYAGEKAADAASGRNIGNTYAAQLRQTFLNPKAKEYKWSTPEELDAVRAAKNRDYVNQGVRLLSNAMGGSVGMYGGGMGIGAISGALYTGNPKVALGALVPAVGYGLKSADNAAMVARANELANTFAKNSPMYRSAAANAPTIAAPGLGNLPESIRNAITLEMLHQGRIRGYTPSNPTEE